MKFIINLLFAICILTSCLNDFKEGDFDKGAISSTIKVKVEMPNGHVDPVDNMMIKFTDLLSGLQYYAVTDANGVAVVDVAYGTYIAVTDKRVRNGDVINIYNGTTSKIRVTPKDPKIIDATLNLNYSKSGQVIIKEFYYGGCWDDKNNKVYNSDKYFTLYNNSNDIAYLDSICVGIINPLNAPSNGKVSDWVKPGTTELRDSIPCGNMVWMFKGNGKDIVLGPGKEIVCCLNATNHSNTVSASVDLSKTGYFALWAQGITTQQTTPAAGVLTLDLIWSAGRATAFPISNASPGLVIFTMGGKPIKDYIKDNVRANPKNPSTVSLNCLFVDKNLVLDGLECFKVESDSKRFRPEVDNGFAMLSSSRAGQSIIRKVDKDATIAGGPIIYVDTNNSTNDFETLKYATLTGKK